MNPEREMKVRARRRELEELSTAYWKALNSLRTHRYLDEGLTHFEAVQRARHCRRALIAKGGSTI